MAGVFALNKQLDSTHVKPHLSAQSPVLMLFKPTITVKLAAANEAAHWLSTYYSHT